ncbi:MAG: lysophospholipid acyltransferase family protein [Terriglobales bacterium]
MPRDSSTPNPESAAAAALAPRRARHRLEYAPVWLAKTVLGAFPRPLARAAGMGVAAAFYGAHRRLIAVGRRNLALAFPKLSEGERRRILRRLYRHLGRQLAEFCLFPRYRRESVAALVETAGLEHYLAARAAGRGVLILTAHLGAWEVSSFVHSLNGYPLKFVIRPLDNPYLNAMVNRSRGLHGNQPIGKRDFARQLIQAMHANETVGILLDQNSSPPQGVFVPFFGVAACTAVGLAKIALRTGAAVVPGFTVWEEAKRKYVLRFEPALPLVSSGDEEADVLANTAAYAAVLERWIRRYPDQWLWVHRRWKTRPAGEPPLY